jgi:hypothetical protein
MFVYSNLFGALECKSLLIALNHPMAMTACANFYTHHKAFCFSKWGKMGAQVKHPFPITKHFVFPGQSKWVSKRVNLLPLSNTKIHQLLTLGFKTTKHNIILYQMFGHKVNIEC